MTIFEAVKANVTPRMAAERYGLHVSRSGMVRCLFHDDATPSMKLYDDHYHYNPLSSRSFSNYLAQHADDYNLEATNNIRIGSGKRCRGYLGIEILNRPYVG